MIFCWSWCGRCSTRDEPETRDWVASLKSQNQWVSVATKNDCAVVPDRRLRRVNQLFAQKGQSITIPFIVLLIILLIMNAIMNWSDTWTFFYLHNLILASLKSLIDSRKKIKWSSYKVVSVLVEYSSRRNVIIWRHDVMSFDRPVAKKLDVGFI